MWKIGTTFTLEKGLGIKKQNRNNMEVEMWVYTFHKVFNHLLMTHIFGATLFRSWTCIHLCLCVMYGFVVSEGERDL